MSIFVYMMEKMAASIYGEATEGMVARMNLGAHEANLGKDIHTLTNMFKAHLNRGNDAETFLEFARKQGVPEHHLQYIRGEAKLHGPATTGPFKIVPESSPGPTPKTQPATQSISESYGQAKPTAAPVAASNAGVRNTTPSTPGLQEVRHTPASKPAANTAATQPAAQPKTEGDPKPKDPGTNTFWGHLAGHNSQNVLRQTLSRAGHEGESLEAHMKQMNGMDHTEKLNHLKAMGADTSRYEDAVRAQSTARIGAAAGVGAGAAAGYAVAPSGQSKQAAVNPFLWEMEKEAGGNPGFKEMHNAVSRALGHAGVPNDVRRAAHSEIMTAAEPHGTLTHPDAIAAAAKHGVTTEHLAKAGVKDLPPHPISTTPTPAPAAAPTTPTPKVKSTNNLWGHVSGGHADNMAHNALKNAGHDDATIKTHLSAMNNMGHADSVKYLKRQGADTTAYSTALRTQGAARKGVAAGVGAGVVGGYALAPSGQNKQAAVNPFVEEMSKVAGGLLDLDDDIHVLNAKNAIHATPLDVMSGKHLDDTIHAAVHYGSDTEAEAKDHLQKMTGKSVEEKMKYLRESGVHGGMDSVVGNALDEALAAHKYLRASAYKTAGKGALVLGGAALLHHDLTSHRS